MSDRNQELLDLVETRLVSFVQEATRDDESIGTQIQEATGSENYVDAGEAQDGWIPLTMGNQSLFDFNEAQLQMIRDACRIVVTTDEVAKNVVKNYQNFTDF